MGQKQTRLPTMTDQLLGYYLDRTPDYSFVAEKKGGLVGFCLVCRWGATAWMGPIAVLPPAQGTGIGRSMVEASIAALRNTGITTLGLETMPRSYRNLQFYSRLGLNFEQMTLDLSRVYRNGPEVDNGRERQGLELLGKVGHVTPPDLVVATTEAVPVVEGAHVPVQRVVGNHAGMLHPALIE